MKLLDKIALVLFSSIILILSSLLCFAIFGWIKVDIMALFINNLIANDTVSKIALGILVILILLAIKGIFFGILIQN